MVAARLMWGVTLGAALCAPALAAQEADRLWGRVETVDGTVAEGFLRWGRAGAAWVDVLPGTRVVPREHYRIWSRAWGGDGEPPRRVVELMGFRISWNEDDPDFPLVGESGVRFGHVREVRITGAGEALVSLRSGAEAVFERGWRGPGRGADSLEIDVPGAPRVRVGWDDLHRVTFGPAPPTGGVPGRLHGTVRDRWGVELTGYVAWDTDELLSSDILEGRVDGGEREIPFREIEAMERTLEGTRVTGKDGSVQLLAGSSDVGTGHRGVAVSDPGLGVVTLAWDDVASVRLHPPEQRTGYQAFPMAHRLRGDVVTLAGEVHSGTILWDADETWSWELLDGSFRDVGYDVEFGAIASIRRTSSRGALVTLVDGRSFELEDSHDLGERNRGIFVQVSGGEGAGEDWILVSWDELAEARFHHD